ncbi:RES domain-containing protein [Rhizobium lentis]|uniref:RES domain-containing protein n=1 Tax=Rhizobium lentis TaxID=1138194 RepID=UPI0035C92652
MKLDKTILQRLAVRADVTDYVRIIARAHAGTPLGMGFGKSRFSSPKDKFQLLYLAQDPMTAVAETIVRDRFQGKAERVIFQEEFDRRRPKPGPAFPARPALRRRKPARCLDGCRSGTGAGERTPAQPGHLRSHRFRRHSLHVADHQQAMCCRL